MKKSLLILFFLQFSILTFAQNFFENIKSGKTHWVYETKDKNGSIGHFGFYADSIKQLTKGRIIWFSKRLITSDYQVQFEYYSTFFRVAGNVLGEAVIENPFEWKFICMNEDTLLIPKSIPQFDSSLVLKKYGKEIWVRNISKVPNLYNSQLIDPNTTTFEFYARGDSVNPVIKSNFDSCFFHFLKNAE